MSQSRQTAEPIVRGYAVTHPPGRAGIPIEPGWHQLLYTASGVLTVRSRDALWTVPLDRVVWIPAGQAADIDNRRAVAVRALYLDIRWAPGHGVARTMNVPPFGRALLHHIVRVAPLYAAEPVDVALATVLVDQLSQWTSAPLNLPLPTGVLGRAFADAALARPDASIDDLAKAIGSSRRTVERVIRAETGISVGAWRRRARILASLDTLAESRSVTKAAADSGYAAPSAYVAAFAQELGSTPGQLMSAR